jgi:pilus assembly protein CpaB
MRAAAVRINEVSGVAGFIQPNDTVDVLITRQPPGNNTRQVTDVLLQSVKVIAIDQDAKGGADGQPVIAKTATLEVNPTDAQKLALAQQVGTLSFVLRKPGQEQDAAIRTVSLDDLRYSYYGGARVTPAQLVSAGPVRPRATVAIQRRPRPARVAISPQRSTSDVEVVRGTQGSKYEVGGYGS